MENRLEQIERLRERVGLLMKRQNRLMKLRTGSFGSLIILEAGQVRPEGRWILQRERWACAGTGAGEADDESFSVSWNFWQFWPT